MNNHESNDIYKLVSYYATTTKDISKEEFYEAFREVKKHSLILSASCKRIDHLEYMIQQGYDMNEYDSMGCTMLHYVGVSYDLDRLKLILDYGADVNKKKIDYYEKETETILHRIAGTCYYNEKHVKNMRERLEMLMRYGADPNITNGKGQRAIGCVYYWIRIVKQRRCRCQYHPDSRLICIFKCWNCRKIDDLNEIIECIQNYEKKSKTLFVLMLPDLKKYKFTNNKRQRKK